MGSSFDDSIAKVEDALFCSAPSADLSYADPDQKWIIRHHLVSLFQDFSSFKPSSDTFIHNDGTEVRLLRADGEVNVAGNAPPVPLTIWVHEFYPRMAAMVYVDSTKTASPIHQSHPFVASSGDTTSPYLLNWLAYDGDLSDLVRNLVRLFSNNHPFYCGTASSSSRAVDHSSAVKTTSALEATERLTSMIFYDVKAAMDKSEEEIRHLSAVKEELQKRGRVLREVTRALELKEKELQATTGEFLDECGKISNWLKLNDKNGMFAGETEDVFECNSAGKSESWMELRAGDAAREDLMFALDKAVAEGAIGFGVYMKQLRTLAREQFFHRAKMNQIQSWQY